ncbi:MAG: perilipin family protein [Acidobacteriia bacterium]|jgi:hypothetical protein|nr:perilipin family protein [Terriglobia bacterium]
MNERDEARPRLSAQQPEAAKRVQEWLRFAAMHQPQAEPRTLPEFAEQIRPQCSPEEFHAFVMDYFACQLSVRGDPGHLQTVAQKLVRTFWALADLEPAPTETLLGLKQVLGAALRSVDDSAREILVTHCLEPLFESRRIAAMFTEWEDDDRLRDVYQRALAWGEGFWPHTRGG